MIRQDLFQFSFALGSSFEPDRYERHRPIAAVAFVPVPGDGNDPTDRRIPLIRHPWLLRDDGLPTTTTNRQIPSIPRPCLLATQQPQPVETRVRATTIAWCTLPSKVVDEPTRMGPIRRPRDNLQGLVPQIHLNHQLFPSEIRIEQILLNLRLRIHNDRRPIPLNLLHRVDTTTDVRRTIPLIPVSARVPAAATVEHRILPIIQKSR